MTLYRDPVTGAGVFVCGRNYRPSCRFPAEPAPTPVPPGCDPGPGLCPSCGRRVDTYITEDGRTLAYRHSP